VYYGLTIGATDIAGDKYLNFSLASFVEIPACLLNWAIMEGMSRKNSLCCVLVLSGVTCFLYILLPASECTHSSIRLTSLRDNHIRLHRTVYRADHRMR
jgi:hypothetical protein